MIGHEIHQKRSQADDYRVLDYTSLQPEDTALKMYQFALVAEPYDDKYQGHYLCQDSRHGRTPDAHVEGEDKQRVQNSVEQYCHDGGGHGLLGMAGRAQQGVEAEIDMGNHITGQDYLHVLTGI